MVISTKATGRGAARRRFWLAMSGFALALLLVPFSYKVERRLETAVHIKGGESEIVGQELAERFQSPYAHRVVLVINGLPDADSAKGADALSFLTTSLRSEPGVAGAVSSLDWPDPLFTGKNGGALIIVGLEARDQAVEALVPKLRVAGLALAAASISPSVLNGEFAGTTRILGPVAVSELMKPIKAAASSLRLLL